MKSQGIRDALAKANMAKFGSVSPFGNEVIQEKSRQSLEHRFGTYCYFKSEEYA